MRFVTGDKLLSSRNGKVRPENPTTGKALLSAEGSQAIVSQDGKPSTDTLGEDGRAPIYDVETGKLLQVQGRCRKRMERKVCGLSCAASRQMGRC